MFSFPLRFAAAELRHERLFAIGVILAVCSVLTPAFLLLGVRNGMIESLRERLKRNPQTRELRLKDSVNIPIAWFERLRSDPKVGFLVPSVREISLQGEIKGLDGGHWIETDMILPSGSGDPVFDSPAMNWNSGDVPVPCVLSFPLAGKLHATERSKLTLRQVRIEDGRPRTVEMPLYVQGVAPVENEPRNVVYLPVQAVEFIEDYKDGKGVPLFDWPSMTQSSVSRFHGIVFPIDSEDQDESARLMEALANLYDRIELNKVSAEVASEWVGLPPGFGGTVVIAKYPEPKLDEESLERLATVLSKGDASRILPFIMPSEGFLKHEGRVPSKVIVRTEASDWWQFKDRKQLFQLLPMDSTADSRTCSVVIDILEGPYQSTLRLSEGTVGDTASIALSPQLSGIVGAALVRPLTFDQISSDLRITRLIYNGFRLYAASIDDVTALRQLLDQEGYPVSSEEDQIAAVKSLDSGLTKLLALIAGMGAFGGLGALSASLYLSVERAKRQLCVLRILGASRTVVTSSIVLQGVILSGIGTGLATLFYHFGARLLQRLFSGAIAEGEVFCRLPAGQLTLIALSTAGVAGLVGLLASYRLRNLDIASVARSE